MGTQKFRRLPITKLGKIKGILTVTDIIRAIAKIGLPDAYQEKIIDWMTPDPKTIHPDTTIIKATKIMSEGNFGSLLLTDDDILKGILTERDILREFRDEKWDQKKISDFGDDLIKTGLVRIKADLSLEEAIKEMDKYKTHRVLTIDDNGKLQGILTANDITGLSSREREEINANPNFLKSLTAQFVATEDVLTGTMDMSLSDAVDIMCRKGIGSLPLIKNDDVVGILTERSIVHIIANMSE
jgi:CBS domain-containing protein